MESTSINTTLVATQSTINITIGQPGGSNPLNQPLINLPLIEGLNLNVVALINTLGGVNWEAEGGNPL